MSAPRLSSRISRLVEYSLLTTDVARALRSSVAFTVALVACLATGHVAAAAFVATAAQNIALADVRGDYRMRLAVLVTMTVVMAASVFVGTVTGSNIVSATLMMGALALLGGVWRHLSGDYGPNVAIVSALLFLIALSQPGDARAGLQLVEWVGLGGLLAIVIQMCGWFFRPQHALRHAVGESWVAASDLMTAMRTEKNDGEPCVEELGEKEQMLRAAVDQTLKALESPGAKRPELLKHLDDATQMAARLATRVAAFHTAIEPVKARRDFAGIEPTLDSVFRTLASAARSAALTIIMHRREQFIALEIRLQRCAHLIKILDERLGALNPSDTDVAQARQMLGQVAQLLPDVRLALAETVDHGAAQAGFALRLPELNDLSLRSLSSWMNPEPQLDAVLVRYTLRVTVIAMIAVALYKWFDIPRGYWMAFTALVVLQPDYGATRQKAGQRVVGTLAGSVLASALIWVKLPVVALIGLAAVMAFGFAYFVKRRYGLAVFFVTLMLVLLTESLASVNLDFTVGRLLSNVAGGVMALLAALFFWPSREQEQFPKFIAAALRANRKYLEAITGRLAAGEPFAGPVVQAKREIERANSQTSTSLQRLLGEPSVPPESIACAAAWTAYNQRVTRSLTVLAVHLNKRERFPQAELTAMTGPIAAALESLAREFEVGKICAEVPQFTLEIPASGQMGGRLIYSQLAKVATEIEAMGLAGRGAVE